MGAAFASNSPYLYVAELDKYLGSASDGPFRLGQGICIIGENVAKIQNAALPAFEHARTGFFEPSRDATGFLRAVLIVIKLFTLRMFYEMNEKTGELLTESKTVNSRSVERYKSRDFTSVVLDICLLAGRLFSSALWLQRNKAYDLGKHAGWMNAVVVSAFTVVTTGAFIASISKLFHVAEESAKARSAALTSSDTSSHLSEQAQIAARKLSNQIAIVFQNFSEFLSMPWENGLGFNTSPALSLAGGVCLTVASSSLIVTDLMTITTPTRRFVSPNANAA